MTVITPCRPATPEEIPANARSLAKLAEANGWTVATTYARGDTGIKLIHTVDSVAVRMSREGQLVAIWHDGKFHRGLSRSRPFGIRELRKLIAMSPEQLWAHTRAALECPGPECHDDCKGET